jgi:hypothetical protein
MLIVSKDKDYYDSAVGMGIDKTIVYERHERVIDQNLFWLPDQIFGKADQWGFKRRFNDISLGCSAYPKSYSDSRKAYSGVVGFCGKLYPFIKFYEENKKEFNNPLHLTLVSFDKDECYKKLDFNKKKEKYYYWSKNPEESFLNNWEKLINFDPIEVHRKFNAPIFVFDNSNKDDKFVINSQLKGYKFVRLFDPYMAFQEVQMFVSGVLGTNEDGNDPVMTEKQKVGQHGFDDKYGFRTRPKKK